MQTVIDKLKVHRAHLEARVREGEQNLAELPALKAQMESQVECLMNEIAEVDAVFFKLGVRYDG